MPELYEELKRLAEGRIHREPAGYTLRPTALVHEAYLRLASSASPLWNSPAHFFGAAAEAMRRILIEQARRHATKKRGGELERIEIGDVEPLAHLSAEDLLALDEALSRLELEAPRMAEVVKLRFFSGRTIAETASLLEISEATVSREWTFARTWLYRELASDGEN